MTESDRRRLVAAELVARESQEALETIVKILDPIEGGADRIDLYTAIGQAIGTAKWAIEKPAVRLIVDALTTQ